MAQNVRGLGDPKKVRHLVNKCHKLAGMAKDSLFLLQETYVTKLDILRYIWRGEMHLTPGSGNSLGCITFLTAPFKILRSIEIGQRGHILAVTKNDVNRVELIVVNVYAPNGFGEEKIRFFEELVEKITEVQGVYTCDKVILAGDLNLVFNLKEVKNRNYSDAEKRVAANVDLMFQGLNLVDSWDSAVKRQFTWATNRTGEQAFSTLDRVLYTKDHFVVNSVEAEWGLTISDHAAVITKLNKPNNLSQKSTLISRLDARILLDPEGSGKLMEVFLELFGQRSVTWNPHVSLEYCKMCIRTAANSAAGMIKARYRDDELSLNNDINNVIDELAAEPLSPDRKILLMHKLDDLRLLKRRLVEKIGAKIERRTARQWYNEGELSNKYFFNLLNRRTNDEVTEIINDAGDSLTDPVSIEAEIRRFYTNLYESVPDTVDLSDNFFRNIAPLSDNDASTLVAPITIDQLKATLDTCADSAPGPDGIPYSFLKFFWEFIGPVLVAAWDHSLVTQELPPSHKVSYLRLIPKAGKDIRIITNLRPITLSNTDHKLITKTYARKMTALTAHLISREQTAYIPGRLINDNVRAMQMSIDLANSDNDVDGLLVSLDAKKAFDSVDHRYIKKCLAAFGMTSFIPIFETLYKDLSSQILLNGNAALGYRILKGVKQGDALSCILFIICIEPLLRNLKSNDQIEPISSTQLDINIPKAYSYADDVAVLMKNTQQGLQSIFDEYECLSKASGLILNADKTELLCFNSVQHQQRPRNNYAISYIGERYELTAKDRIKVNGIWFLQDPDERERVNVELVLDSMERILKSWSTRRLTLLGRILIIKTFAVSKAVYLMQSMSLNDANHVKIMKLLFKYLWNRNFNAARAPERIKRSVMLTPVRLGGFGMVDIKALGASLDLRAYGRMLTTEHPFLSQLKGKICSADFFSLKIASKVDKKFRNALKMLNEDRKAVLKWPPEEVASNLSMCNIILNSKLENFLTGAGKQTMAFFVLNRRLRHAPIKNVTRQEFINLERFLIYPELRPVIRGILAANLAVDGGLDKLHACPVGGRRLTDISKLTSKQIRVRHHNDEEQMICIFKAGLILTPGELLAWTKRTKKLTSTRHKNILLRLVHGDIFSNSRLHRFGLREGAGCANCPEPVETILHRVAQCPNAVTTWEKLNEIRETLKLNSMSNLTLENLIGARDNLTKIELALQAEVILRLTSRSDGYDPGQVVNSAVKLVLSSEHLTGDLKNEYSRYKMNIG